MQSYIELLLVRYPDSPDRTLARIAAAERPDLYTTERARGAIRYSRGKLKKLCIPKSIDCTLNDYVLDIDSALVIGDLHFPYHNEIALASVLDVLGAGEHKMLILDGDMLDMYALSRFEKDPALRMPILKKDGESEISCFVDLVKSICDVYDIPVVYKLGNHEDRMRKFLRRNAPELAAIPDLSLESLLKTRLSEYPVEIVPQDIAIDIGDWSIIHGHEVGGGSGKNPALAYAQKVSKNTLAAHNHATSEHREARLDGGEWTVKTIGCMCSTTQDYARRNRWCLGYGEIFKLGERHIVNTIRLED